MPTPWESDAVMGSSAGRTRIEIRPGLRVLAAGLLLGTLADLTLRELPWGLNATALAAGLVAVILWLQADVRTPAGPGRIGYALAALAVAAGLAWRDATVLKVLDLLGLVAVLGLLASTREATRDRASLAGYLLRICGSLAHAAFGPPLLVAQDVDWSALRLGSLLTVLLAIGRGLAIALPILMVFTALLASADPMFALRVAELLDIDVLALLGHAAGTGIGTWIAAGLLRAAVLRRRPASALPPRPHWLALGRIEITLVLASIDVLFAAFVWIQVRYLFGGVQWVQQMPTLTYSEYARRGFFELCAVTALVLPLLLVAHWLLKAESRAQKRTFAALAGTQVLLVLLILASAFERMRLYREEYGLTELRFYTTVFMGWLAVLLVLFLGTVLRGRRDTFARAATASAGAAVLLLHVADPEARIIRGNATLARPFDVPYALELSADAVPALIEILPSLDPTRRGDLACGLLRRWSEPEPDWRTSSLARLRAREAVQTAVRELRAAAARPPALPRQ